jgi:N-acetylglucosamine-6-phosphate deacetylase
MADTRSDIIPGFVDLQVNGTHGIDFSAPALTRADCLRAFDLIRRGGTAAFLPTVITSPLERLRHNLGTIARAAAEYAENGSVAGIHLEGPFLDPTPGAIGAHNPEWVLPPDTDVFDRLQDAAQGAIRLLTVSAGIDGVESLIRHATSRGVVVSLGHQMAGYDAVRRAADAGAALLTHLGNGLPHQVNRHENPLLAGLAEDRLDAMFIADGHHLPDELMRIILRIKGVEHAIVVSDAAPVAGLPPGRHTTLGNVVELTPDGLVINPENRYLAGSGRTMFQCMNHLADIGLPEDDLVTIGSRNPARALGIDLERLDGPRVTYDRSARRYVLV